MGIRAKNVRTGSIVVLCFSLLFIPSFASAEAPLQSNNYRFDEATLGAGGQIQSTSSNFQSANSAGDIATGDSASTNFQSSGGSQTTNDPTLTFSVGTTTNFSGNFSASTASTATSTFSVTNYTSFGYVVQMVGTPPKNGGKTLTALTTGGASSPGSEQFGINLVANSSPSSVGANPVQTVFGQGVASTNYNTPNQYRYVSGDVIAQAPKSSGQTNYTITYLVNVAPLTPGGKYTSNQTLIVTGTY